MPSRISQKFTRAERIGLDREIKLILNYGNRLSSGWMRLLWIDRTGSDAKERLENLPRKTDDKIVRLAIRFQRKFVNAVTRNRVKRLIREVFRWEKDGLRKGSDILVVVRPFDGAEKVGYGQVRKKWDLLCKNAGIAIERK